MGGMWDCTCAGFCENKLAASLEKWGRLVARRPWTVLICSALFFLACMGGIPLSKSETETKNLWTPMVLSQHAFLHLFFLFCLACLARGRSSPALPEQGLWAGPKVCRGPEFLMTGQGSAVLTDSDLYEKMFGTGCVLKPGSL
jgi:hypothetical protein